jgi:hypothetical protein
VQNTNPNCRKEKQQSLPLVKPTEFVQSDHREPNKGETCHCEPCKGMAISLPYEGKSVIRKVIASL